LSDELNQIFLTPQDFSLGREILILLVVGLIMMIMAIQNNVIFFFIYIKAIHQINIYMIGG